MVPHLAGLAVERLSAAPGSVHLLARTCACEAACTGCGVAAGRTGRGRAGPGRQRWDEGVRSAERLHAELRDRGYRGSLRTLRRLTARLRRAAASARGKVVRSAAPHSGHSHFCKGFHQRDRH